MEKGLLEFLSRARERAVTLRGEACALRILPARAMLELRRAAAEKECGGEERALFADAALLARCLLRGGEPVFATAEAVLETLGVGEINALVETYAALERAENPSAEDAQETVEALKKA